MLFLIIFTINVGIDTYFVYYKNINRDKETGANESFNYQTTFNYETNKMTANTKRIDIKNQTY